MFDGNDQSPGRMNHQIRMLCQRDPSLSLREKDKIKLLIYVEPPLNDLLGDNNDTEQSNQLRATLQLSAVTFSDMLN